MSFFRHFLDTLKDFFTDTGVFMIAVVAPIIYGAYYPWPYSSQIVRKIPIAVVDNSNDSLSRQIIRFVTASPTLIVDIVGSEKVAQQQLAHDEVMAYMVIPADIRKRVIRGQSTTINMVGHGGYLLPSKNAQQAMAKAIGTVSAGIEIKRLSPLGLSTENVAAIRDPVPLKIDPLNNPNEGYGSYVVPAVIWLILQQTLFIGCAMLIGTWYERNQIHTTVKTWLARITAIASVHSVICIGATGWLFSLWGYAAGGNPWGNILLISLFSPCTAIVGCLLGLLIKDRERSMQLLVFTALPMFFISGFSWPTQQLPLVLQWLRWVLPSTSVINAGVNLNQLGATVSENVQYFKALGMIMFITLPCLLWFGRIKEVE